MLKQWFEDQTKQQEQTQARVCKKERLRQGGAAREGRPHGFSPREASSGRSITAKASKQAEGGKKRRRKKRDATEGEMRKAMQAKGERREKD